MNPLSWIMKWLSNEYTCPKCKGKHWGLSFGTGVSICSACYLKEVKELMK